MATRDLEQELREVLHNQDVDNEELVVRLRNLHERIVSLERDIESEIHELEQTLKSLRDAGSEESF